ncbi:pyridoxal-5'-phosphate-dependent enzyme [Neoconidiobolus thromboides FSU 785]|nr:pyridoxal-5'-phosphate-dependent enzyme [Neoconidiobolus thromboides FSU 785]
MTNTIKLTLNDIEHAASKLEGKIHTTPVLTCSSIDSMTDGKNLYFKCENLQKIGAFKIRGATYAIGQLVESVGIEEVRKKGIVAHSSGNHAQAVALASKSFGINSTIVLPNNCSKIKVKAVLGYGAKIVESGPSAESRVETAEKVVKETGGYLIPPFDHKDIVIGQGTAALELLKQTKEMGVALDAVIAPVSGGGLLSGTLLAVKGFSSSIKGFAGEPKGADDCYQSIKSGKYVPSVKPNTIADGLRSSMSDLTYGIIKENLDDIFTVTEDEIIKAMRIIWERMKLVVEPSGAVPLAAILFNEEFKQKYADVKNIGLIISGGNIELDSFFDSLK